MNSSNEIKNLWYLNINSESGTAIGKCGSRNSSLSDIDIVAGFITASQQLSHEMVTSDEVSKYSSEDIKGGGKRFSFPTTWGNEITSNNIINPQESIPIITTMLQVSGPKMTEYEYNNLLRFISAINDEIVFRFMLGELTKERIIDPIINIDIINNVLNEFSFNKKGRLIGPRDNKIEKQIEKTIIKVLRNDTQIIDLILSKIPLKYTCMQESYKNKIKEAAKFIRAQINEFLNAEEKLNYFRNEKIYAKKDSFKHLRETYFEFLDSQETYFENKRALHFAIDEWHSILEDLHIELQTSLKNQELKKITELQKLIPTTNSINDLVGKSKIEKLNNGYCESVLELENKVSVYYTELEYILSNKNYSKYNEKLSNLKNGYETIFSIINEEAQYDFSKELEKYYDYYKKIDQEEIKTEIRKIHNSLRKNLVVKVINSTYDEIFNSYRKFKLVIVYSGNIKELIYQNVIKNLKDFINRIQDYSFASILEKIIKRINPDNLTKRYCIDLLENYLQNYVYDHFIHKPFIKDETKTILALDSYSLKFCSELLNDAGLNKEIYKEIEKMKFSQNFKESFIQILDNFVLTRDNIIQELKNSHELFNSWLKKIDLLIQNLQVEDNGETAKSFINYCSNFTRLKSKSESKAMKKKYYIKEKIFNNFEPTPELKNKIIQDLSKKFEIKKLVDELEDLNNKSSNIFSKKEFSKLLNDSKVLLLRELNNDKKSIQNLLKNLSNIINSSEAKKINQLLDDIKYAKDLLKDNKKLELFEKELNNIIEYDLFYKFVEILESLDNEFLNLEGFSHIKGIVKTFSSSDSLIEESNIEKKHESRELLMEAFVEMYAHLYEDYFGKFAIQKANKIDFKKFDRIIKPGKLFYKQYEKTINSLQIFHGFKAIKSLFEYIIENKNKYNYFKIDFLVNYLSDYYDDQNYKSPEEFIQFFNSPRNIGKFLDYLINKFTNKNEIKSLKQTAEKFCKDFSAYLAGKQKNKPILPQELNIFKDDTINTIFEIYHNIQRGEEKYYLDQKHPNKTHPSRKYNFKSVTPKKLQKFLDNIDKMDSLFINEISSLEKLMPVETYEVPLIDNITKKISETIKSGLNNELEKYTFTGLIFENENRIRIMGLLNETKFEIPRNVKIKLIQEGMYNRKTIEQIIKLSKRINEILIMTINASLSEEPSCKELFALKINNKHGGYIKLPINIPNAFNPENLNKLFGKNIILSDEKDKILAIKLPFDNQNKTSFGEAMKASVYKDIFNELKPTIDILNKHSREIHTRFKVVNKKLYEY